MMVGGGMAITTRQKDFCGLIMGPPSLLHTYIYSRGRSTEDALDSNEEKRPCKLQKPSSSPLFFTSRMLFLKNVQRNIQSHLVSLSINI